MVHQLERDEGSRNASRCSNDMSCFQFTLQFLWDWIDNYHAVETTKSSLEGQLVKKTNRRLALAKSIPLSLAKTLPILGEGAVLLVLVNELEGRSEDCMLFWSWFHDARVKFSWVEKRLSRLEDIIGKCLQMTVQIGLISKATLYHVSEEALFDVLSSTLYGKNCNQSQGSGAMKLRPEPFRSFQTELYTRISSLWKVVRKRRYRFFGNPVTNDDYRTDWCSNLWSVQYLLLWSYLIDDLRFNTKVLFNTPTSNPTFTALVSRIRAAGRLFFNKW